MSQESIYVPGETYTSARATPELVGREEELKQIEKAIRDTSQSYIVYITGEGGIGKTRLVKHVLEHPPDGLSLAVASELIDLYHTSTHTVEGLVDAIQKNISPGESGFERYREGRKKLDEYSIRAPDRIEEIYEQRAATIKAFLDEFNELADQHRIVLALDTAEKLFFQEDPAAQQLGLTAERPAILNWLLHEFLPNVRNTVVLLAGRPGPGDLAQALERISNLQFLSISLGGLTEQGALAYFEAVIESAKTSGDEQTAEAIQKWSEDDRKAIFHCLRDEGEPPRVRPILLALAIDHLAVAGHPLPSLTRPLTDARALTSEQRREIQADLGSALVQTLHDARRPADEVIIALGWLRKGADADLLARITGLDQREVENALEQIQDLSFVKVRPADERRFLHDEMYDLLQQHGLDQVSDAERERVFNILQAYYDEHIDQARYEIAELHRPLAEAALPQVDQVIAARGRLRDALVEDLHYRLRWNAAQGFQSYFRYAEEAIAAYDESLDMQLQAELLSFLAERDPSGQAEEVSGLRRADVLADAAVRWMKRLVGRGEYQRAQDVAQRLHEKATELLTPGGALAEAELDTWEGLALAYLGKQEEAGPLLDRAITRLLGVPRKLRSDRWSGILARAYNNLGYYARIQEQITRAGTAYCQALPYWRHLAMETEQANTLNNLAFVLSLQGKFSQARRQGQDALGLRERMGALGPMVLSLTTLAEIEIYAGRYREAREHAQKALTLAQAANFRRGEGLARLALAALQRFWGEPEPMLTTQERQDLLKRSLEHSREALRIFTEEVQEPERAAKARYEQALTLREQCRLLEPGDPDRVALAQQADDLFEEVAKWAQGTSRWDTYLDTRLSQAWMHYYLASPDLQQRLDRIGQEIHTQLPEYLIQPTRWPGIIPTTTLGVFSQLARYHILKGVLALDQGDHRAAGQQFALAFEYDRFISEDFRDLNRGIDVVYGRLRKFNERELAEVFDGAEEALGTLLPQQVPGRIERKEDLFFWQILENHFGAYRTFHQLAG